MLEASVPFRLPGSGRFLGVDVFFHSTYGFNVWRLKILAGHLGGMMFGENSPPRQLPEKPRSYVQNPND
jgi:hypothetical protein